jgi:single-stranded DNA-binding protein
MFDYALVQLLGRATSDATFSQTDDGRITKAVFTMACNVPIQRNDEKITKTVFRRVMVLGSYAKYVFNCQEKDGLKGRLINVVGIMDDEKYRDETTGEDKYREVARIAPVSGFIKIMDRPLMYDDQ